MATMATQDYDPENPLNLGGIKLGKYRRCESIGKGSFATVFKGLYKVRSSTVRFNQMLT